MTRLYSCLKYIFHSLCRQNHISLSVTFCIPLMNCRHCVRHRFKSFLSLDFCLLQETILLKHRLIIVVYKLVSIDLFN